MSLIDQIKRHEGFEANHYRDSEGFLSIGYGHNIDKPMPKELATLILHYDLDKAHQSAKTLDYWKTLSQPRKDAITNMIFNLGFRGFQGFRRMNAALYMKDYELAAVEALDSKWAVQVGDRARELASQIRNGEYAG